MQDFLIKKDYKTVFCKVQVAKYSYLLFFFQNIWSIQKKVVPLHSKRKNKFNQQKQRTIMGKKIKTITLFNNYDGYDFEEWKKSYLEANCIENVSDNVIWDYISMIEEEDINNAIENLKEISCGNKWVVSGRLGLWNGTHDVTNIFSSTEDMVYEITKDCDYIKIWFENNNLFIQASHHDGTNTFQCKVLTNKGLEMFDIWNCGNSDCKVAKMNDYELYNLLFDNNFYSKNVKYVKIWDF